MAKPGLFRTLRGADTKRDVIAGRLSFLRRFATAQFAEAEDIPAVGRELLFALQWIAELG